MSELFTMPKISFIVTSYNYEKYIEECLESIAAQKYPNIEIVVVEDFSNDNSVDVIEKFISQKNQNIKFIKNKKNIGQLASIFRGIRESTGEFIACIDSDDKIASDYASVHILTHLNIQTALSVCDMAEINENSTILSSISAQNPKISDKNSSLEEIHQEFLGLQRDFEVQKLGLKKQFFGGWWWAPTSCGVFRRAAIEPFLNFRATKSWKTSPDKILFNYLHLIGGSTKIKTPLVYYRRHGENAGDCAAITGDKRFNSNKAKSKYFINQINLYKNLITFILFNFTQMSFPARLGLVTTILLSIPKLMWHKIKIL